MIPSNILLDAIAEIIALEPRDTRKPILHGLESIVFALCEDTGIEEKEIRAELETRVHLFQLNQRKMRVIVGGLSKNLDVAKEIP